MAKKKRFIDYPRWGRTGVRRWLPSWRLILGTFVTVVVLGFASLAAAVALVQVPEPNDVARAQVTTFYWNDGTTVLGKMSETNRTNVALSDVPKPVQQAVLAAEDRDFYDHGGFSPSGLVRAFWNNFSGGSTQGASTITQQYTKNAFLTQERSYVRKVKELVLSMKLELQTSKDEILGSYLNTVYYGRNAYGIEAASQAYFGIPASQLTTSQGAVLAALLQSPNRLSPTKNPKGLQSRWNYVLDGMVIKGWLTQTERDQMKFPAVKPYQPPTNYYQGTDGYLLAAAQREMLAKGYTEDQLNIDGLKITTTFDGTAQAAAVEAVDNNQPTEDTEGLRIGLASVTPGTGAVVAMYGGPDFQKSQYNNADQARGQAGSTFKPFGLAAGLANGVTLDTYYNGDSPQEIGGTTIENYGNTSFGTVNMLTATENSINTPYMHMNVDIGPAKTKDSLVAAGIPANTPGLTDDATNVLGAASTTAEDLAGAYATLAARGKQVAPTTIKEIRTASGELTYSLTAMAKPVYPEQIADQVTYALRQTVSQGTASVAQGVGRPVAAKTGTTDDNMSAWFAGYAPQMATAVMMVKNDAAGNNVSLSGTGGLSSVTGGSFPGQIWTAYMSQAMADLPVEEFVDPETIYQDNNLDTFQPTEPTDQPSQSPTDIPTPTPTETTPTPEPTPTPTPPTPTPVPPTPTVSGAAEATIRRLPSPAG